MFRVIYNICVFIISHRNNILLPNREGKNGTFYDTLAPFFLATVTVTDRPHQSLGRCGNGELRVLGLKKKS